jgi:hypothetical protein
MVDLGLCGRIIFKWFIKKIGCKDASVQGRAQWRVLENTLMNLD